MTFSDRPREPMSEDEFRALPAGKRSEYLRKLGLREDTCDKCGAPIFVKIAAPPGATGSVCKKCVPPLEITCPACGDKSILAGGLPGPGEGIKCIKCGHVLRED